MSELESDAEGETITTYELLERSARAALKLQREDGSFPPARNAYYDEPETPVRTTSHWLTTLSTVYDRSGESRFADAANEAADYLLSDSVRPHGFTFHSRSTDGKDRCDGLIGQARPIQALAISGPILDRPGLTETAVEVFNCVPFVSELGLWQRREVDGSRLSIDRTLNHQILFAAAVAQITSHERTTGSVLETFLDNLVDNIDTHNSGIIKHTIRPPIGTVCTLVGKTLSHWTLLRNELLHHYYARSAKRMEKEIGYHSINLRGLAKLKQAVPDHPVWNERTIRNSIEVISSEYYTDRCYDTNIEIGSSMPELDNAVALATFEHNTKSDVRPLLREVVLKYYNFETNLLDKGAPGQSFRSGGIHNLAFVPNLDL